MPRPSNAARQPLGRPVQRVELYRQITEHQVEIANLRADVARLNSTIANMKAEKRASKERERKLNEKLDQALDPQRQDENEKIQVAASELKLLRNTHGRAWTPHDRVLIIQAISVLIHVCGMTRTHASRCCGSK